MAIRRYQTPFGILWQSMKSVEGTKDPILAKILLRWRLTHRTEWAKTWRR